MNQAGLALPILNSGSPCETDSRKPHAYKLTRLAPREGSGLTWDSRDAQPTPTG